MNTPKSPITRRSFLGASTAAVAGLALGHEAVAQKPAVLGSGRHTYTQVEGWGAPPDGMSFKMGCAIVVDRQDNVYVHSQAERMVVVYDKTGKVIRDFGTDFSGKGDPINRPSCHGLYLQRVGNDEFLYFSVLRPYDQVIKTDLHGKVLMRLGKVGEENTTSIKAAFNNPTDVAVAPNGDIYVCEGYGGNVVRRFNAEGKQLGVIGTPGTGPGQFRTCHGIWVDTRRAKPEPELYIADRNNGRIQVFTLEGTLKREVKEGLRNPCCFYQQRGLMFIPDLDKVVTILDREDRVVAQLGDGKAITDGTEFSKPHALTLDSEGSLYVVEWVADARLRKFKHTPAAA
jgi:peptidylamidoglycolate lyase